MVKVLPQILLGETLGKTGGLCVHRGRPEAEPFVLQNIMLARDGKTSVASKVGPSGPAPLGHLGCAHIGWETSILEKIF